MQYLRLEASASRLFRRRRDRRRGAQGPEISADSPASSAVPLAADMAALTTGFRCGIRLGIGGRRIPTYQDILADELKARQRKNSQYSLRSLARDVGVSSGFLSQVLASKRHLSEAKAHQIVRSLAFTESRALEFVNSVRCAKVGDNKTKAKIRGELKEAIPDSSFHQVPEDTLGHVQHWHGLAVYELLGMPKCPGTVRWLARRLGLTIVQVSVTLERLEIARLVTRDGDRYVKAQGAVRTPTIPSETIKKHHASVLDKAKESLHSLPFASRDASTVTMCIDPSKVDEARERIRNFRRELMTFLESGPQTQLFAMHINLFRLDKDAP